jgi:2-methylfumaryl-CoA hydratase
MKTSPGRFFEDFRLGERIRHATPRTVTAADAALYSALYGSRFAVQSSDAFARRLGYAQSPLDDWLVFHVVFGKTVPDISINAVANLGYADGRFLKPVHPGATLASVSEVIGLKESSNGTTGVVYVRSTGFDVSGDAVLTYCRWVLVNKRDAGARNPDDGTVPTPEGRSRVSGAPARRIDPGAYDAELAEAPTRFGDYARGERNRPRGRHDRGGGRAPARHAALSEHRQGAFRPARREGGPLRPPAGLWRARDLRSPARSPSTASPTPSTSPRSMAAATWRRFCGRYGLCLERGARHRGARGGARMRAPCACAPWATKNQPTGAYPGKAGDGYDPAVILDLDYWALLPR